MSGYKIQVFVIVLLVTMDDFIAANIAACENFEYFSNQRISSTFPVNHLGQILNWNEI